MGNQTEAINNKITIQKQFEFTQLTDQRFGGPLKIIDKHYNKKQLFAEKNIVIISQEDYKSVMAIIQKRHKCLTHPNFITINKSYVDMNKDICSQWYLLRCHIRYLENDLDKEIKFRKNVCKRYFSEPQICKLIYQISDCLRYLKQNKAFHGDIRSMTIFLDQQKNAYLYDSEFINYNKTNLEFTISKTTSNSYLSPAQLENIKKGSIFPHQINKNQIYSLGMTLIQMMLLQPTTDCYQMLALKINEQKLIQKIRKLYTLYSRDLVNLVTKMIQRDQVKRIDAGDIIKFPFIMAHNPNKKSIKNFPKKMMNSVQYFPSVLQSVDMKNRNQFRS